MNRVLSENPFRLNWKNDLSVDAPDSSIHYSGLDVFNEETFSFPPYGDVFDFLS